jgi:NADP-dependent aldehyde dehydrogenase
VTSILSVDPRTGAAQRTDLHDSTGEDVLAAAGRADIAAPALAAMGRARRADLLDGIADALEDRRADIVDAADRETALGATRLNGELTRSTHQSRLFGEALREGSYLEAAIDHAGQTPLGPGPDVRRMLVPIGPVAVFGASNFPFAFSVPGGDTASALAAGCPVVLKGHGSHVLTSRLTFEVMAAAAARHGAPDGTLGLVLGQSAGTALVTDPRIKAVSFTGSLSGGRALLSMINSREEPIPFFGELSSLNPLVVTEGAAAARGAAIAAGLLASVTGSGGQLCTKPGVAFLPAGASGDALVAKLVASVRDAAASVLLNRRIFDSYGEISERIARAPRAEVAARGRSSAGEGFAVAPTLVTTAARNLEPGLVEECFGPLLVVVRYDGTDDLAAALEQVPRSLTATIHSEESESERAGELTARLMPLVGRLVYNGYPTGVRVCWAQHHGGPWPATNSQHSSVGVTALRRFLRPVAWQDAPQSLLPEELRDGDVGVPRRVDGVLTLP